MSEQDRIFFKNFALLIAGLMVFTVVIAALGFTLNKLIVRPDNPDKLAPLEERIRPIGEVYAGSTGRTARAEAMAATPEPEVAAAFDGSLDGEMIYNAVCTACHTAGVAGAPKLVQADWDVRMEQGMDMVVANAINGFTGEAGLMPAKGGRTDLSDEQVRVTVQWMLDNLE